MAGFFIFIGIIIFHGVGILILKINVSSHFKSASWFNKIGHVIESLHVPAIYKDFDVEIDAAGDKSLNQYQLAYNSVLKETLWMTIMQMISNLFLLAPLFLTDAVIVPFLSSYP